MLNIRIDATRWGFRWIAKLITRAVPKAVWDDLEAQSKVTGVARREWRKGRYVGITLEQRDIDVVRKETA